MGSWRRENGQATVEYAGLLLLVALALIALGALDLGPPVSEALAGSACHVSGGLAGCGGEAREPPRPPRLVLVDRYMRGSLEDFLRRRGSAERDPRLDWSTDHCSAPVLGDRGLGYDFADACLRHDFGYRNYARLGLFRRARGTVDRVFLRDMRAHCALRTVLERVNCHQRALQYYAGVRAFGGRVREYFE